MKLGQYQTMPNVDFGIKGLILNENNYFLKWDKRHLFIQ